MRNSEESITEFSNKLSDCLIPENIQVVSATELLNIQSNLIQSSSEVDWVMTAKESSKSLILATSASLEKYPGKNIFVCYCE